VAVIDGASNPDVHMVKSQVFGGAQRAAFVVDGDSRPPRFIVLPVPEQKQNDKTPLEGEHLLGLVSLVDGKRRPCTPEGSVGLKRTKGEQRIGGFPDREPSQ